MHEPFIEMWTIHNRIHLYLISDESHHRGQIEWALRAAGQPLSDKISYGLWEWDVR